MLDGRIAYLIAVGASVAANCQPCLQTNIRKAMEAGADAESMAEAMAIGKLVRGGAASGMDAMISQLGEAVSASALSGGCGCGESSTTGRS